MDETMRQQILAELAGLNRARPQQEDEFTIQQYAMTEQLPRATARNRLESWVRMGFAESRLGRRPGDNRRVCYYRITNWDGLKAYLTKSPFIPKATT